MPVAKELSVLVVDDHASVRALTRHSLGQIGITDVTEAEDGEGAMVHLSQRRFSLVIADWVMKGMDGLALLKQMRQHPLIGKTPFILITARTDPAAAREAVAAGVNNFIVKPFNPAVLHAKISAVVGKLT